ncbi:hypothetical protein HPPN120_06095 [Helicobacter pylori Puno120]|nr:hypothetical protein HPPN120_06095 [Helicobacter pylori Puno120]
MKSFSPFNSQLNSPKRKRFLKITAFPLTKKAKKDLHQTPTKIKT